MRYTPPASFRGSASFTYVARDVRGADSNPATVKVTVADQPRYDLQIATTPSNDVMRVGQEVFFNVLVSSLGGTVNAAVEATDRLSAGFTYRRHEASAGSYDPATGVWTIGTINAGTPTALRIFASADSAGSFTNVASLTGRCASPSRSAPTLSTRRASSPSRTGTPTRPTTAAPLG